MAGEQLLLDPTSESTGTQLDITDATLGYYLISHEYPDPDIDVVHASSIDTEGAVPAAGKHQPRTIGIVIRCVQATGGTPSIGTIVSNLQRKIGKLFREGGTYRRVLPSGDTITFDVLRFGARINVPAEKRWISRSAVDVTITLTCQPYGLGPSTSVTLTPNTATSKAPLVCAASTIKGDVPALGELVIQNVTATKTLVIWGLRSRHYDSGSPLFYEAESLTAGFAVANAGFSGASGAGANKVMRHSNVGLFADPAFNLSAAHIGTYRVFARVQASTTNTGTVSVRVSWFPRGAGAARGVVNDWVPVVTAGSVPIEGSWVLADLGLVTLPEARLGSQAWYATFDAKSTVATDDLDWDWIALVPVDEGSGRLEVIEPANHPIQTSDVVVVTHDAVQVGSTYYHEGNYEGDYLRVPPSGAEARVTEIFALVTGPTSSAGNLTDTIADAVNIDAVTASMSYRPRYLSVPAP